ncbi:MAG TPA: HD domain-containing protein [Verrucomicrobiae bacterium]|nr:HD domain-containing protein [Verrucomicrobiae bacterium]
MSKPSTRDLINLVKDIVFPFYSVKRHTALHFDANRFENDAEHSWSVAFVALSLAPHTDTTLDVGKVCQFATVHDLVEVYAGDTSNFADASKRATKEQREEDALHKLEQKLTALPWVAATVREYEAQVLPEARFVKSIDKLLPLLFDYIEEGFFYHENKITMDEWKQHMQKHREKAAKHPGVFEYYEELWDLLLANPHLFHQDK